ncbi:hypothetical protein BJ165DRAFT_363357 [Panaeolus papilionaceus]|nr:hypothetical protein BJ165DRAFT_363357 [Panaeolus papilionaceus]
MTDLTVLISPIPLYPLTAAASGNGTGKRWSRGPQPALAKPIMVTLERDAEDVGGSYNGRDERGYGGEHGKARENESEGRRDNGTPPRGRRGSRSDIVSSIPSSSSSSASTSANPSSTQNRKSPPRLTNPPPHVAQDPDFIHPPRKNRPRAGPPRVVDKHLLSPPVNTWKSRPAPSPRVSSYTTRGGGSTRGNEENNPATRPKHRPTRSQSLPPDRRSFVQIAEQDGQYATVQDPSHNYVLRSVPPMMPIRVSKQAEVDEKLQLPFGDTNWRAGGGAGVEVFQPRTQKLVGEPEQAPMPYHASPHQLMSPSVDSLGLNLGLGLDDDDDTPLALTRLQKRFARRSFGGVGANEEGRPVDGISVGPSVKVEPYRGKGQEVQTAPINGGFRPQPIPRTSMRGGELLKPPPPLFRPTTFWRNHPRSGVASASYSPSTHLIRRATYLAAGLNFDAPVHDLSALCVESRIGSIVVKSEGEGAGLI